MFICKLSALNENNFGGKAQSLNRLIKAGLPVPQGYAIASEGFEEGRLKKEAAAELDVLIKKLDRKYTYAVRSSAVGEDGAESSFAGAYETILDVKADDVRNAVNRVAESADSGRVSVYAEERNARGGKIGVIVQRYISPEFAGVLFTADEITAGREFMKGSYVKGAGEKLVSGEGMDGSFSLNAVNYSYDGPAETEPYMKRLYSCAKKAEKLFGCPQDMEWAFSNGRVYILQSRPITTLHKNDTDSFEINDSLCGELLLSKTNVGEIFLRPISPVTCSAVRKITDTLGIPLISNVCGQLYLDISGLCSMIMSFGCTKEKAFEILSELAGGIPEGMDIPVYPFDKKAMFKKLSGMFRPKGKKDEVSFGKDFKNHIAETGIAVSEEIKKAHDTAELKRIWEKRCIPYMKKTLSAIATGLSLKSLFATRAKLEKLCGNELADRLLSNCSWNGHIESIGTLLAVDDVINCRMTRQEYVLKYGHRHADEMELSCPYPYENESFPDNVIEDYIRSGINAYEMKAAQEERYRRAVEVFKSRFPSKASWLERVLKKYSRAVHERERVRSEALRLFCVIRAYLIKAGELTELGNDIFMLYIDEVERLLSGEVDLKNKIAVRRKNYEKQLAMPKFPSIICGRFTVEEWQQSGGAAGFYRYGESCFDECDGVINGLAGACGQAEGIVRVLGSIDEADGFEKGEILVVPAANIGWIKIFPKAAAVVTDIGAPLSHAVIVARELGIPAVVSCQCASGVLKTGDRVKVDGTAGKVYIL
ncbi:MAG: hypothetical protein IJZ72_07845 [Oscillospiraceae bacterium]|nr:hypothetical protein [Oscillospiraceae bacterium]